MLSSDSLRSWAHEEFFETHSSQSSEAKATMESPFESYTIREFQTTSSTLQELKPLQELSSLQELRPCEQMEFLNASPDTSVMHHDPIGNDISSGPYRLSMGGSTFIGYNGTPEPVSTTTSPLSSSAISVKQEEADNYVGAEEIDDLANMIGCTNSNAGHPTHPITINDHIEPALPDASLSIEDWLMLDVNRNEITDSSPLNSSDLCTSLDSPSQQPSTTTQIHSTGDYSIHHSNHIQQPISLTALLAAGTHNNNSGSYLHGISMPEDSYQKAQPILYNKLTQPQKETITSINSSLLKTDPIFSRSNYYHNKDSLPHSTDSTSYAVTTSDDILVSKFDHRYLDNTQIGSPDSDLSSTQLGYEYGEYKGKNRTRLTKQTSSTNTKLGIRTEGTKDKPIHHCTVCNRGFLNKSNIKVHLRTHTGEKPFRCETCNKAFRQKAHLLKHYQIHKRGARD